MVFVVISVKAQAQTINEKSCTTVLGQKVCADIEQVGDTVYIRNFEPNMHASKAAATALCEKTGLDPDRLKVKFSENDRDEFAQIKCKIKLMRRVRGDTGIGTININP